MSSISNDTKYFSRRTIAQSELAHYETDPGATSYIPRVALARQQGFFYVFLALQDSMVRHLDNKPTQPKQRKLIVSTLKEGGLSYETLLKHSDDLAKPVPWWFIKPLLRWQQSGDHSSAIPASGARFTIEIHPHEHQRQLIEVLLRLDCGSLHSEWHLRPDPIERQKCFPVGSVFLSAE